MQRELLDQRTWQSREELGQAIFEWIEAWYNPKRRRSDGAALLTAQAEVE